jgi:ABC-type multidrug transport system ATPase subunit
LFFFVWFFTGAGKTTLLNVLARRTAPNSGKVLINGQDLSVTTFRRTVGYVPQTDALVPSLTVRETMDFYAALKLPHSLSKHQRDERVEELLTEFGLAQASNTYIGGPTMQGISGGQRRRVSIAIEMLSEPSCLLLDEPTSGLDAATAMTIMHTILGLARTGRTVVCTIHQPRSSIWHLFDRFMLLCDGRVVYCGAANNALDYFSGQGFPCPTFSNPADHFVDMVTASPSTGQSVENVQLLKDAYPSSPMHTAELDRLVPEDTTTPHPHLQVGRVFVCLFSPLCGVSIYMSVCLSVCLSVCMWVCLLYMCACVFSSVFVFCFFAQH